MPTLLLGALRTSTVSGEAANIGRDSSYKTFMCKYNELMKQGTPLLANPAVLDLSFRIVRNNVVTSYHICGSI